MREKFELGCNKPMNDRLKFRISIIKAILSALDNDRIKAQVLLIADTTKLEGNFTWKVTYRDKKFSALLDGCISQFVENI